VVVYFAILLINVVSIYTGCHLFIIFAMLSILQNEIVIFKYILMKKTLLLFCAAAVVGLGFQACNTVAIKPTQINVAGLVSETGNWSTLGIDSKEAMKLAAEDINTHLALKKAHFRMTVSFYDTRLDPETAKSDFITATAPGSGSRFVIGPQSSAELAVVIPYASSTKTIVVSQGSTAGSLAIAGDGVFRFCPSDKVEGAAIANTMYNDSIRAIVTVARNDAGNLGLQSSTGARFAYLGGVVNAMDAYSTDVTDFTAVLASIKAKVSSYASIYGKSHTAVYLASFDECAQLFAQASTDSALSQVRWYGADGVALSVVLKNNNAASRFAARTNFIAPSFGLRELNRPSWQPVADRITANTGIVPDAFALAAYDAMWVIAKTLMATGGSVTDYDRLKAEFAAQADQYEGTTGNTKLDPYGDRNSGIFDYWGLVADGSGYKWVVTRTSE